MHQDDFSEIVKSFQARYIEGSGLSLETASSSSSSSNFSLFIEATSTASRSQDNAAAFESIPKSSSPPQYLPSGEWDEATVSDPVQCGPTCRPKSYPVIRISSRRPYPDRNYDTIELSYPNTPGLGLSPKVSEIAETPAQLSSSEIVISSSESVPIGDIGFQIDLASPPLDFCGPIIEGTFACPI